MFEKIRKMIGDYTDYPIDQITPQTEFLKDIKLNSFNTIALMGALESELGVTVDQDEIKNIVTVGDLVDYVKSLL